MAKKRFKPITKRVNLIIIISLVLGISILISGYFIVFLITIDYSIENSLRQQSDILYKTIEKLMLTGQAPDAVDYFNDINLINPLYTIKLFRTSGSKAFTDNTTIETVNSNIGMQIFTPRTIEIEDREQPIQDYFIPAINLPPQTLLFQTKTDNKLFFRIYKPLINLPRCTKCHGGDHTIRGVIDIRNDITFWENTRLGSLGIGVLIFLIIVIVLWLIIRKILKVRSNAK